VFFEEEISAFCEMIPCYDIEYLRNASGSMMENFGFRMEKDFPARFFHTKTQIDILEEKEDFFIH